MVNGHDEIIGKIQKLLALAERAGTEEEASTAAATAARLLAQYSLTRAEVEAWEQAPPKEEIVKETVILGTTFPTWLEPIYSALDASLGTRHYYSYGHTYINGNRIKEQKVSFFGRKTAAQTAAYLLQYLRSEIERLSAQHKHEGRYGAKSWHYSFKLGAAWAIHEKMTTEAYERRQERKKFKEKAASTGATMEWANTIARDNPPTPSIDRALVAKLRAIDRVDTDAKEVADEYDKFSQKFTRHRSSSRGSTSGSGWSAGRTAGKSIRTGGARGALGGGAKRLK